MSPTAISFATSCTATATSLVRYIDDCVLSANAEPLTYHSLSEFVNGPGLCYSAPMDLFSDPETEEPRASGPLADRMRPRTLDEVVGQDEILAPGRPLRVAIEQDTLTSLILWGPPGSGKTSLARLIAAHTKARFEPFSAATSGLPELRRIIKLAEQRRAVKGFRTILFVDEIHRFNKAQQDAFLPHVESGTVTLIGATTENPSFEVISPLLSRSLVVVLQPLSEQALARIIERALKDSDRGLGKYRVELEVDAML